MGAGCCCVCETVDFARRAGLGFHPCGGVPRDSARRLEARLAHLPEQEAEHVGALLPHLPLGVADAVAELIDELPRAGRMSFRRLTDGLVERLEVIVRFLALLELFKQGLVELDQTERFGDIDVVWTGGELAPVGALPIDDYEG